jgi:hypothetical protein
MDMISNRSILLFCWILVNTVSVVIGLYIGIHLNSTPSSSQTFNSSPFFSLALVVSLAQSFLLINWLRADLWLIISTISWYVGFILESLIVWIFTLGGEPLALSSLIGGAFMGGLVGLSQYYLLKNKYHKAELWILSNICGYGLGFALAWGEILTFMGSYPTAPSENLRRYVFMGFISGCITGVTLWKILQEPKTDS